MSIGDDNHKQDDPLTTISTLEMLLDYAIAEGARLQIPFFVSLIKLAREELASQRARESASERIATQNGPVSEQGNGEGPGVS